ncbi:hypothetical protein Aduo_008339 [Ancylostoma duodenale]
MASSLMPGAAAILVRAGCLSRIFILLILEIEIPRVIDVENMVNHREVQEIAPLVVRESGKVCLRRALDMAELVMDGRSLEVNALSTRLQEQACRTLGRACGKREKEEKGGARNVRGKIARGQVSCIGRTASDREAQTGKSLAGQGFGSPEVGGFSFASEVKETEVILKSDGKMRLTIMVALNGVIRHLTGFYSAEEMEERNRMFRDYYRSQISILPSPESPESLEAAPETAQSPLPVAEETADFF